MIKSYIIASFIYDFNILKNLLNLVFCLKKLILKLINKNIF